MSRAAPRFLITRHPTIGRFTDVFYRWVEVNYPSVFAMFDVHYVPAKIEDWSSYVLHVPWLQDPVQHWSLELYDHSNEIAAECDARGIPVINRVDRLINATKSVASRLMAESGARTARTVVIDDFEEFKRSLLGMPLPLFVREDWGHGGTFYRVDEIADAGRIPYFTLNRPVAVELLDLPNKEDGFYRKYRYVAAGEHGVSHHLQVSTDWIVRGEFRVGTDKTRQEELDFIARQDPNHETLQRARKALGLDLIGFDYGYDYDGRLIIWEANPFPFMNFGMKTLKYRNAALHRTFRAILRMYFEYASLPVPERIGRPLYKD